MPDSPPSPKASRLARPGWWDGRLVLGLLMVLVSVVVGARVLASADDSQSVWVATRDLAAGSTLGAGDLAPGRVRLFEHGDRYLLAGAAKPVGYVLLRAVGAQELLPSGVLTSPQDPQRPLRDVAVPVAAGHLPDDLQSGQQVDVYVTPVRAAGAAPQAMPSPAGAAPTVGTVAVVRRVTVARGPQQGRIAGRAESVVLSVPLADAQGLVAATRNGEVDLVRVPHVDELPLAGATAR